MLTKCQGERRTLQRLGNGCGEKLTNKILRHLSEDADVSHTVSTDRNDHLFVIRGPAILGGRKSESFAQIATKIQIHQSSSFRHLCFLILVGLQTQRKSASLPPFGVCGAFLEDILCSRYLFDHFHAFYRLTGKNRFYLLSPV